LGLFGFVEATAIVEDSFAEVGQVIGCTVVIYFLTPDMASKKHVRHYIKQSMLHYPMFYLTSFLDAMPSDRKLTNSTHTTTCPTPAKEPSVVESLMIQEESHQP